MPVSYAGTVSEHNATRGTVGLFDVSHLGKALVRGPGRRLLRQLRAHQRPGPDRAGQGAVHVVLHRFRRRHRRPDRLLRLRRRNLSGAQRRQHRRGGRRAAAARPGRPDHHRRAPLVRRAGRAGPEVGRGPRRLGLPTDMDYMGYVDAEFCGVQVRVCRTGYTGEHGYELLPPWDEAGVVFDALVDAVGRGRRRARRPGRPRHAAHRDGLPAARPRTVARHLAAAGPLRLGHRLEERTRSGAARRCWPKKRPVRDGLLRGLRAVGRGVLRPELTVLDGDPGRHDDIGNLLSDFESRDRAWRCSTPTADIADGQHVSVDVRGRPVECEVVKPPFVEAKTR